MSAVAEDVGCGVDMDLMRADVAAAIQGGSLKCLLDTRKRLTDMKDSMHGTDPLVRELKALIAELDHKIDELNDVNARDLLAKTEAAFADVTSYLVRRAPANALDSLVVFKGLVAKVAALTHFPRLAITRVRNKPHAAVVEDFNLKIEGLEARADELQNKLRTERAAAEAKAAEAAALAAQRLKEELALGQQHVKRTREVYMRYVACLEKGNVGGVKSARSELVHLNLRAGLLIVLGSEKERDEFFRNSSTLIHSMTEAAEARRREANERQQRNQRGRGAGHGPKGVQGSKPSKHGRK